MLSNKTLKVLLLGSVALSLTGTGVANALTEAGIANAPRNSTRELFDDPTKTLQPGRNLNGGAKLPPSGGFPPKHPCSSQKSPSSGVTPVNTRLPSSQSTQKTLGNLDNKAIPNQEPSVSGQNIPEKTLNGVPERDLGNDMPEFCKYI